MRLSIPARARKVAEFPDGWTLYAKPDTSSSFLWCGFRLMLPPDTPKRNGMTRAYDLSWSPTELRFSRHRESLALESQHPELFAQVQLCLELEYGPDWLASADGGGYTAEEIQAERDRLEAERAERKGRRQRSPRP